MKMIRKLTNNQENNQIDERLVRSECYEGKRSPVGKKCFNLIGCYHVNNETGAGELGGSRAQHGETGGNKGVM